MSCIWYPVFRIHKGGDGSKKIIDQSQQTKEISRFVLCYMMAMSGRIVTRAEPPSPPWGKAQMLLDNWSRPRMRRLFGQIITCALQG
jgi:hypothetical protein